MELYTLGYQGISIFQYIDVLKENGVTLVCDVRNNPFSFKVGFSKKKFQEYLMKADIEYVHLSHLGVPQKLRKKAKGPVTRRRMFEYFENVILSKDSAVEELQQIIKLMSSRKLVLTCFERDHTDCHRFHIAERIEKISKSKVKVVHLYGESLLSPESPPKRRRRVEKDLSS
jgi:uncharacterized protein (DUF488 family)